MKLGWRDIRDGATMVPILVALCPGFACKAKLPQQLASDASGDFPCTQYADLLAVYSPAGTEGGSEEGRKTLGPPDGDSVTLTPDAVLTVAFVGLGSVIEETGSDIQVYGSVAPNSEVAVYVAATDGVFVYSGALSPDNLEIDLSVGAVRSASSVRLVGITGQASVDAFQSQQTTCP